MWWQKWRRKPDEPAPTPVPFQSRLWQSALPSLPGERWQETLAAYPSVVLFFWARWDFGSERFEQKSLLSLLPTLAGKVAFFAVDVDKEPDLCAILCVQTTPTLIGFLQGREVQRGKVGTPEGRALRLWLASLEEIR